MKPELNLQLVGDTLTIREGKALELKEPVPVNISGTIVSVYEYLLKRASQCAGSVTHIIVDREKMSIKMVVNETDHYRTTITGSITPSQEFTKWGINDSFTQYHSHELAQKIKMNRYQFVSLEKAGELVNVFQNLRAKVQREVEHNDNSRGSVKKNFTQVVNEMTIPEKFEIITPLFKGDVKRAITVEIVIDPESLKCSLISPDAVDIIARERDAMIDAEIKRIDECDPGIPIFEI